jgi:hypothetical protein
MSIDKRTRKLLIIESFDKSKLINLPENVVILTNSNTAYFIVRGAIEFKINSEEILTITLNNRYGVPLTDSKELQEVTNLDVLKVLKNIMIKKGRELKKKKIVVEEVKTPKKIPIKQLEPVSTKTKDKQQSKLKQGISTASLPKIVIKKKRKLINLPNKDN